MQKLWVRRKSTKIPTLKLSLLYMTDAANTTSQTRRTNLAMISRKAWKSWIKSTTHPSRNYTINSVLPNSNVPFIVRQSSNMKKQSRQNSPRTGTRPTQLSSLKRKSRPYKLLTVTFNSQFELSRLQLLQRAMSWRNETMRSLRWRQQMPRSNVRWMRAKSGSKALKLRSQGSNWLYHPL